MDRGSAIAAAAIVALACAVIQTMGQPARPSINVEHITKDFSVTSLYNAAWKKAPEVTITKYWSGKRAPAGRHFKAQLLWSDSALYVRFEGAQNEPLIVSRSPDLTKKTIGLWDRDVCEIFLAPDPTRPNKYFEFEIAPTGEWLDLGIEVLPDRRVTDWDYSSGMTSAARIEKDRLVMAIRVEWKAFGTMPKPGDEWLGNIFRCVGKEPGRGYLAWQPTMTERPNFHVPHAFGKFVFQK